MKIGQKVICVNAAPHPEYPQFGTTLIEGNVYVVAGFGTAPNGNKALKLIGVIPPREFAPLFSFKRFRLLDELKLEKSKHQTQIA